MTHLLTDYLLPIVTVACLFGAACVGALVRALLPPRRAEDNTQQVLGLITSMLAVLTSVLLALMVNSARGAFDAYNENIHALATEIILLDRNMRTLGPEGDEVRRQMLAYVRNVLKEANILEADPQAEAALDAAGLSLRAIRVSDEQKLAVWNDGRDLYRQVLRDRWVMVDGAGMTIPNEMFVVSILLLSVVFYGLGYRGRGESDVTVSLLAAALLFAAVINLTVDMATPGIGLINPSSAPFERALAQLQR